MKFILELLCSDARKHYNSKALPTLVHTKFVFLFYYDLQLRMIAVKLRVSSFWTLVDGSSDLNLHICIHKYLTEAFWTISSRGCLNEIFQQGEYNNPPNECLNLIVMTTFGWLKGRKEFARSGRCCLYRKKILKRSMEQNVKAFFSPNVTNMQCQKTSHRLYYNCNYFILVRFQACFTF